MAPDPDRLTRYRARRDFAATSEPDGAPGPDRDGAPGPDRDGAPGPDRDGAPGPDRDGGPGPVPDSAPGPGAHHRFVVQQHAATRLHWDLRLEHAGTLASWAVPNGIPPDPKDNRLAVRTEDHPLEYLDFHGEIPRGQYGAGRMTIWDTGTFETHKWSDEKVEVTFRGGKLHGRYGLFPIGRRADGSGGEDDWMIHRMDPPDDPRREPMPERVLPMLAIAGRLPPDPDGWSFEVKWDGVRALAHIRPGRLKLHSRNLNDITATYPEIRAILADVGMHEVILDGEIVAFGDDGRPSFERLQSRMNVGSNRAVQRLAESTPVVFAIFDLLYLDGRSLMGHPYEQRRAALEGLALKGPAWSVPSVHRGNGAELLKATAAQGLEGVVAKRLGSPYEPGRRNGAWLKLKNLRRQELVIGGWLPGEGRRERRIGALLMGVHDGDPATLRYAGRVGTGFSERTLDELAARLTPLRVDAPPFQPAPKLPRNAVFVAPELVAEVEFREWTAEGVMRAPSFKGLRDDKDPTEVVREEGPDTGSTDPKAAADRVLAPVAGHPEPVSSGATAPEDLFDTVERRPNGALAVSLDGRALKLTNWDKVLYPQTGFTKGDLIAYYTRIAPAVLPHLRGRALTLKRYPNGVEGAFFYEKNSPAHRPDWVQTATVNDVEYTVCEDRATLVWLAGLADLELHTSLALASAPDRPTMVVFDLDPGAPADLVQCCEVALVLKGLFSQLKLESIAKVSGSKGMQVYVPLNRPAGYAQTKTFARGVAQALAQRLPDLVVSRMTKQIRAGRVLVDWSQNDAHKTTVSVYSLRARATPTVSAPVGWDEVAACQDTADPEILSFDPENVLDRVAAAGDPFAMLLSTVQRLPGG